VRLTARRPAANLNNFKCSPVAIPTSKNSFSPNDQTVAELSHHAVIVGEQEYALTVGHAVAKLSFIAIALGVYVYSLSLRSAVDEISYIIVAILVIAPDSTVGGRAFANGRALLGGVWRLGQ
jgi:hypothetical protein